MGSGSRHANTQEWQQTLALPTSTRQAAGRGSRDPPSPHLQLPLQPLGIALLGPQMSLNQALGHQRPQPCLQVVACTACGEWQASRSAGHLQDGQGDQAGRTDLALPCRAWSGGERYRSAVQVVRTSGELGPVDGVAAAQECPLADLAQHAARRSGTAVQHA